MPQFRDISTFTEKTSLDGSEEVQVSGTQKVKLVKLLEQLGDSLEASFGSGLTICSYMPADDESLKWELGYGNIRLSYASGNLLTGTPTDDALLNNSSWETYPIRIDNFEGAGPIDAVMTSAAITVKAGDNINASATTLAVTVGGSLSFNTVNKYLRDAVISVAYNAAVTFSAQNSTVVVRKSADIDTVTASSGKKVYTIHWSPLAVQNGIVYV